MRVSGGLKVAFASFLLALGLSATGMGGINMAASAAPAVGTVGTWSQNEATIKSYFDLMQYRGLKRYRFDVFLTADQDYHRVNTVRMMVKQAKAHNIVLRPILTVPFTYGDRTDFGKYPKGDAEALYRQGYDRTYAFVNEFKYDINDYEMQNELNLLVRDSSGMPLWGKGWTSAEFNTTLMSDWAWVLKGMSDAIDKINKDNGLNIRRILNTTSTHFGFLDYMQQKGVKYEVISYHYYERLGTDPNKYWGSFNLFQRLAQYGKPVHFNEVNCAEIYDANFDNSWQNPLMENCNKSLNNTLNYIFNQKYLNVEDVDVYELVDHPTRGAVEGRFGMMYDNMRWWKMAMITATYYAGGTLTAEERIKIKIRGYPNIQK